MSDELDRRAALAMGWTYVKAKDGLDDWYDDGNDGIVFVNRWSPSVDRNDLSELIKEVVRRDDILYEDIDLRQRLHEEWLSKPTDRDFAVWLLTADPAIICEAVCEVLEAK